MNQTSLTERLWILGAGLVAAVAYALYDERSTRRRVAVNILTGWSVATFAAPALCDYAGVTSHNSLAAVSFVAGMFGALLARYAIEQVERNPAGIFAALFERLVGRIQPRPVKDEPKE